MEPYILGAPPQLEEYYSANNKDLMRKIQIMSMIYLKMDNKINNNNKNLDSVSNYRVFLKQENLKEKVNNYKNNSFKIIKIIIE